MSNNNNKFDFLLANDDNGHELPQVEIGTGATIIAASVGLVALGAPIVAAYYARKASVAANAALNAVNANAVQQQETPKE